MRVTVLMLLSLSLASCQTTGGGATDKAYCSAFKPIRWSGSDTLETQKQATAHNAVGRKICGWDK